MVGNWGFSQPQLDFGGGAGRGGDTQLSQRSIWVIVPTLKKRKSGRGDASLGDLGHGRGAGLDLSGRSVRVIVPTVKLTVLLKIAPK
ncbi:predicted protein [Arabidopsis lyrata subsp. lyrata]|uniref:Predicted protein n=1 Tax=Arabidopsis lyrata subsp. lyrata TaxID=81972 RepID=D7KYC2_ARALL|nr:predicted protein [Arabidopsis lyrata subsp. lyrata]